MVKKSNYYHLSVQEVTKKLGIGQEKLAKELGIGSSTLYFWSKNKGIPYTTTTKAKGTINIKAQLDAMLAQKGENLPAVIKNTKKAVKKKRKSNITQILGEPSYRSINLDEIQDVESTRNSSKPVVVMICEDESKVTNILRSFYSGS